jgi:hypothetical protein
VRKVRSMLITMLLAILVVHLLWITVEPMLPYVLVGIVLVTIISLIFRHATRL